MHKMRWLGWVISISLIGSAIAAAPINAQPNQSDTSGTNVWNNTAPRFRSGGRLSQEIIDTAQRLAQELADAKTACAASVEEASRLPRRFARIRPNSPPPLDPNDPDCISPACLRLKRLEAEAKAFLSRLEKDQQDLIRAHPAFRIW